MKKIILITILLLLSSVSVIALQGEQNETAWYKFQQNSFDEFRNFDLVNASGFPTYSDGQLGLAANFNNSVALANTNFNDTYHNLSIATWIFINGTPQVDDYIYNQGGGNQEQRLSVAPNQIIAVCGTGTGQPAAVAPLAVSELNRWLHVVMVCEIGTGIKIYKDGKLNTTGDVAGQINAIGNTESNIGARNVANLFFNGSIDDFRMFLDYELNQTEVDFLYNNGSGTNDSLTSLSVDVEEGAPIITINSPINNSFNANDIINFSVTVDVNTSVCSLYSNESGSFVVEDNITNQIEDVAFILQHDAPSNTTTDFLYYVECNSTTGVFSNSSQLIINYDNQNPFIFFNFPNENNLSVINDFLISNIDIMNFNLNNVSWNITDSGDNLIYSNDTFGIILGSNFIINDVIDLTNNVSGIYNYNVLACDQTVCITKTILFNLTILKSGTIFINYSINTDVENITSFIIVNNTASTFVNWSCRNKVTNLTQLLITYTGVDGIITLNSTIPGACFNDNILEFIGTCSGNFAFCEFFEEFIITDSEDTENQLSAGSRSLISLIPLLVLVSFIVIFFNIRKSGKKNK